MTNINSIDALRAVVAEKERGKRESFVYILARICVVFCDVYPDFTILGLVYLNETDGTR